MSKGTNAGLTDAARPQSVFKHQVLWNYVTVWIHMVTKTTDRGSAVIVDGYAGPGRHLVDRSEASAAKLMAASLRLPASISCFLIEQEPKTFQSLQKVVDEFTARGAKAKALQGTLDQHLAEILPAAAGSPLLLFLDPCGRLEPFAVLVKLLTSDRPMTRWPVTELLANFSADLTRRLGGAWLAGDARSGQQLDLVLGGQWWQPIAQSVNRRVTDASLADAFDLAGLDQLGSGHAPRQSVVDQWAEAVELIAEGFASRLAAETGMDAIVIPVRRKASHAQPIYHLIFLTRGGTGLWIFADAAARARVPWLLAHGPPGDGDNSDGGLFAMSVPVQSKVDHELLAARDTIAANIRKLIEVHPSFKPVDHTHALFGATLGLATETTAHQVLKALVADGTLTVAVEAKRPRDRVYNAVAR